jgi:ribose transport system ATP-binding protein
MGESGAGKSTLMKILAGAQKADAGEIRLDGKIIDLDTPLQAMNLGISIIYQELMLVPHLSVAENIFLGREPRTLPGWVDGRNLRRQAQILMDEVGIGIDVRVPVGGLPLARRQMVEIAEATSRKSKVIVMDEPSATLTEHELEHLFTLITRLKQKGIGIVYISHRMEEVFHLCDRVTVMRDGKTVGTSRIGEASREDLLRLDPKTPQEEAGLTVYMNERHHDEIFVTGQ